MNPRPGRTDDFLRLRLQVQFRAPRTLPSVVDVVEYFTAIQGQEYEQTKWGISLRRDRAIDDDIEKELVAGTILRTHLLRPTWHFVSKKDIPWVLKLTAPGVERANAYMYKRVELDAEVFSKADKIIVDSLTNLGCLTRDELGARLRDGGIVAEGLRLVYIMMQAELEGIVCSGPRRGKQFTYRLLEGFGSSVFDREEATVELTERYFSSRGPATVNDFSTWSGLRVVDIRKALEACGADLSKVEFEGKTWYFRESRSPTETDELLLLPIYDEYIMGYKDRSLYFQDRGATSLPFDCMIVLNGLVVGTWKRKLGKEIDVDVSMSKSLTRTERGLFDGAIGRLGAFYGKKVKVNESK